MKLKLSSILLILSILFFSCSNSVSQQDSGEGSITLDTGKVARYLGQRVSNKRSVSKSIRHQSGGDFDAFLIYEMNIKLSTIGDYQASEQKNYTKNITNVESDEEYCAALEEFFRTSSGTPISIDGIPVGSKIKVKVSLSFGSKYDEEKLKAFWLASSDGQLTEEDIEGMISEMQSEDSFTTVEGESSDFIVKSGANNVTIHLDGSEFYEPEWQNPIFTPDYNHPIILFNGRGTENVLKAQSGTQSKLVIDTSKSVSYTTGASLFYSISEGDSITTPMFPLSNFCFADDCIYLVQDDEMYKVDNSTGVSQELGIQTLLQSVTVFQEKLAENPEYIIQIDCLAYHSGSLYFPLQIKRSGYGPDAGYFVEWKLSSNEISYYTYSDAYSAAYWDSLIVTSVEGVKYLIKVRNGSLTRCSISVSESTITLGSEENCSIDYEVSDIQVLGNTLYIACYKYKNTQGDPSDYLDEAGTICNVVSAGGIAKIDLNGSFALTNWSNGETYLGMYLGKSYYYDGNGFVQSDTESAMTPPNNQDNHYFYGARKFIARKPDDDILVVADDGVYIEVDNTLENDPTVCENKNRVVTVNLLDESISAVDVNVSFYASVTVGTGFGIGN